MNELGKLYLIPTPIGNLEDITLRALRLLEEVDLILAEDTRHTQKLLNHFEITTKQLSFHEHNALSRIPECIERLLNGEHLAQVSDAGTPSISDPGFELVQAAIDHGIQVVPLPGAVAATTALIASGLSPQPFLFYGFLSRKKNDRLQELQSLKQRSETVILYESPHRIQLLLKQIEQVYGSEQSIVLARELTKHYEEFIRGTVSDLIERSKQLTLKGEFVVLIGAHSSIELTALENTTETVKPVDPLELVEEKIKLGEKTNQVIKEVARQYQMDRQQLYRRYHGLDEEDKGN
ncbi:16S rRNA (cytidine(1402)-2'-O)-methyltransferase [Atopobacter phocae]|uniref:16S rRNA (cytidine(1402)-2'-O)-methyltransferase n=1 Tax=Atopobacter phocae TaxID=136492 RepID=UPI0004AC5BDA|nr:16S rRNA (cytidine(1402)-2'-O)-methyltransferase [Atopobacter phocae]